MSRAAALLAWTVLTASLCAAAAPFPVSRIRLMRSALHPSGATHVEVASFALGADSRSAGAGPAVG